MHWSSWSAFWSMGGYGLYVWGSYGVSLVLIGGEVLALLKRRRTYASSKARRRNIRVPTGFETST